MNEHGGYIKTYRKLLEWEWYKDTNTKSVFLHCLLKANWTDIKYQGRTIPRGSFVTGRKKMSQELGISEQSLRTSINKLKSTNELTIEPTNKYTIITVVNYEKYQIQEEISTNELTNKSTINQPTTNQPLTTIQRNKEDKELKNIKEKSKKEKFQKPTIEEVKNYCLERKNGIDAEKFIDFYESKGWMIGKNPMKDWKACVRTWEKKESKTESQRKEKSYLN